MKSHITPSVVLLALILLVLLAVAISDEWTF